MNELSKIRILANNIEIEIQGTEQFINSHLENLEIYIERMGKTLVSNDVEVKNRVNDKEEKQVNIDIPLPKYFVEWYRMFPEKISLKDKYLIASLFVQETSDSKNFKSSHVRVKLKEIGVVLSNSPNTALELSRSGYYRKMDVDSGRNIYEFTHLGIERIKELLRKSSTEK